MIHNPKITDEVREQGLADYLAHNRQVRTSLSEKVQALIVRLEERIQRTQVNPVIDDDDSIYLTEEGFEGGLRTAIKEIKKEFPNLPAQSSKGQPFDPMV